MANPTITTVYNNGVEAPMWLRVKDAPIEGGWAVVSSADANKLPGLSGTPLSAESQPGDTAVLVMSGQQVYNEDISAFQLDGWDLKVTNPVPNTNRSGYIATRKVTDPAQTQDITWWLPNLYWGARQNGILLVIRGGSVGALNNWQEPVPTSFAGGVIFAQSHGTAALKPIEWIIEGGKVEVEGTRFASTVASWSILRAVSGPVLPTLPGGHQPQAWLTLEVTADDKPATLEGHQAKKIGVMPYGGVSASAIRTDGKFAFAHRGGSNDWPEHTMRAYTNAVATGITGLEISVAKTSDNVWIGCHDDSLARVGGPTQKVANLTYAQIAEAMQDSEYMPVRLIDLLKAYGHSHVIAVDPKYEIGKWGDLRSVLEPYKSNIVMKYFGDADWAFNLWKTDGFATLAYAYESNIAQAWYTQMLANQNLDCIMMEYHAPVSVWNRLKTSGKILLSHITSDQQQIDEGASKGAQGTMLAAPSLLGAKV